LGRREVSIHSRPAAEGEEEPAGWACNARGIVALAEGELDGWRGAWPPAEAASLDADGLYDRLAAAGFEYGPAFQGLESAWGKDEEIYLEVALAEEQRAEAGRFSIHPALLDSALHGIAFTSGAGRAEMPFSWSDARGSAPVATLRARLFPAEDGGIGLELFDEHGAALARVGALALRPVDAGLVRSGATGLLGVDWQEADLDAVDGEGGAETFALSPSRENATEAAREPTVRALDRLQAHLAADGGGRLAILTEGAVAAVEGESPDPALAAAWGLVRSAQAEHPGRFLLVDSDGSEASEAALGEVLDQGAEPQLALRRGRALAPRAVPIEQLGSLVAPAESWRLETTSPGSLDGLELVADPAAGAPLAPREVRVEMRAAGLNFRDLVVALGFELPIGVSLGSEGAGVVVEVGAEVDDLAPGDRVVGLIDHAFAPLAVTERILLAPVPVGWSFERAAAVPSVFGTARYGLEDLAGLHEGERVLIHAAAGGVGLAAIQVARRLGAEIYATASAGKWSVLEAAGIPPERIASSRDTDFAERFLAATNGEGVDVVLNSLAGEFVDASLRLLPRGGRFLEMGKTDIRDARQVGEAHAGVSYRAFDLLEAGRERFGRMLEETLDLLESGAFEHSPVTTWDVREARAAFRHLREGRNVGKVVFTIPRPLDPERTVLITGGTSGLGALAARHLAAEHGARRLLLASRSGEEASEAAGLKATLEEIGAEVTIARCDVSSAEQLEALVASVPPQHPLGAVVHAAGALADATIENLDHAQVEAVFAPKADAAGRLHELTASLDLSAFVLFSSAAGAIGSPGQGNYAAANAYLDALARQRRSLGLPAASIAWGLWRTASGMGAHLDEADLERLKRSGVLALSEARGLSLFDAALACGRADALAIDLDRAGLRAVAEAAGLPPVLRSLAARPRRRRATGSLAARLSGVAEDERPALVVELVRGEAAAVLGHASAEAIAPDRAFKDLGFDSLAAVELRNRLQEATGLRLAVTAVFDHPNSEALAKQLLAQLEPGSGGEEIETREREVRELVGSIPLSRLRSTGLLDALLRLADENGDRPGEATAGDSIDEMDVEALIRATASGASGPGGPVVGVEKEGQDG
jgi:polyketide synthase 12